MYSEKDNAHPPTSAHGTCSKAVLFGALVISCCTQCHAKLYAASFNLRFLLLYVMVGVRKTQATRLRRTNFINIARSTLYDLHSVP